MGLLSLFFFPFFLFSSRSVTLIYSGQKERLQEGTKNAVAGYGAGNTPGALLIKILTSGLLSSSASLLPRPSPPPPLLLLLLRLQLLQLYLCKSAVPVPPRRPTPVTTCCHPPLPLVLLVLKSLLCTFLSLCMLLNGLLCPLLTGLLTTAAYGQSPQPPPSFLFPFSVHGLLDYNLPGTQKNLARHEVWPQSSPKRRPRMERFLY